MEPKVRTHLLADMFTRRGLMNMVATFAAASAVPMTAPAIASDRTTSDPIFAAIERCRLSHQVSAATFARVKEAYALAKRELGERQDIETVVERILGQDPDEYTDGPIYEMWEAYEAFAETMPTTLVGLFAMLKYAHEVTDRDRDAFANVDILATFAAAAHTLEAQTS